MCCYQINAIFHYWHNFIRKFNILKVMHDICQTVGKTLGKLLLQRHVDNMSAIITFNNALLVDIINDNESRYNTPTSSNSL